ncbi:hypothetical protein PFISCL1PPCAC_8564, partial [Pristionchus fissidentatus]
TGSSEKRSVKSLLERSAKSLKSITERGTNSQKKSLPSAEPQKPKSPTKSNYKSNPKSNTKSHPPKSGGPPSSGGRVFGDGKQRAKAYEQFRLLAGDDESIPLAYLKEKLRKQRATLEMTEAQIEEFLKKADKNGDAMIDFKEFESLMASPLAQGNKMQKAMRYLADGVIAKNQRLEVHSYLDAYNCFPPPVFILVSTVLQIAIFLGYHLDDPDEKKTIMTHCAGCFQRDSDGMRQAGPLIFVPRLHHEAWRFYTYQFLHAGISHLGGNIVMQSLLGLPLEIVHKMWRIGPLYTIAVITGALLQYCLDPTTSLVGCSGGVYALITAHLANVFLNWAEMPFRWVRLGIVGVFLCYDIGSTVYRRVIAEECDTISHAAHIGGAITGFCFGIIILHNLVKHKWEEIIRWICIVGYIIFFCAMVIFTIVQEPTATPIWDSRNCSKRK